MVEITVAPRIHVTVKGKTTYMDQTNGTRQAMLRAIRKVKSMPAEELKAAVLEGLADAEAYPYDFCDY